jgi:hypothetical protein
MRVLLVLGFATARLWACTCAVSPTGTPPCQSAWTADAVFTGTVVDIADGTVVDIADPGPAIFRPGTNPSQTTFPKKKVQFKITEALAGISADQKEIVIETGRGGGDCGYGFQIGSDYIVYAYKSQGALGTGICSPTRPIEKAAEDLKYFHGLANAPPGWNFA